MQTFHVRESTSTSRNVELGGALITTNGTTTLDSCILANSPPGGNNFGPLVDGGYNLSSDSSCNFAHVGSLNNTDPKLGPLGDYGGPTPTYPLLAGSPAIDGGNSASAPATDQRGISRPQGPGADIGAFEAGPPAIVTQHQSIWPVPETF